MDEDAQVSFRVDNLADLRAFVRRAGDLGATEIEARNHGKGWSIYFRDPEYNFIEMYVVTPWQVRQPWRVPLDLDRSDDEIVATGVLQRWWQAHPGVDVVLLRPDRYVAAACRAGDFAAVTATLKSAL